MHRNKPHRSQPLPAGLRPSLRLAPRAARSVLDRAGASSGTLAGALVVLASACATTPFQPPRPFPFTEFTADGPLEAVQPADIVVSPVHNQSGVEVVPTDELRGQLMAALVDRLYSPLAHDWADRRSVEAGYDPGGTGADAVLQVVVTRWDEGVYASNGAILAEAEARLLDAARTSGAPLWGVSVGRRLEVTPREKELLPISEARARVAAQLAREVLALLPERDPLAAAP